MRRGLLGGRRRTKVFLALGTGLVASLVAGELALRFLLFSPAARELGIGWRARHATLYTAREVGPESWKLQALLDGPRAARPFPTFDARFGWLKEAIDPVTLAHADEDCLGARRPLLLFGDSYALCATPVCWQELLEESPAAAEYRLLNYGVGGYGLDQMRLLLAPVLARFAERDPLVVVGILVDDDLDRTLLGVRHFPKPRFEVRGDELVLVPVEHADALSAVAADPPQIASYLWRWVLFGSGLVPRDKAIAWTGGSGHVRAKEELCRRLLVEIRRELEEHGLRYFFLLFHARRALDAQGLYGWQEPFLVRTLAELGIPHVSSRRYLAEHLARTGAPRDVLFIRDGPGMNHYTARANEVVFAALLAGLEGRYEPAGAAEPAR